VPSRALRNPLSLVVLGLLAEQPLHPYGMRVLMRERGHDRIVKAGPASLYDAVTRLADAGLVQAQEATREGRRPERTVYAITDAGKAALQDRVRDGLADLASAERFTAALSFMYALPKRQVTGLLEQRAADLCELVDASDDALDTALDAGVPPIFLSEERYSQAIRRAERAWLGEFTAQLTDGTLAWPRASARRI
jgi:DNA-binding PadR family transcriptional regulator